ncbi:hypothetical protein BDK51DRAFT_51763 [Blyttiomyces helicus]|uniref:Uncharacterized protein n=1 Tax=Blyttiomyces helicus TaxID=388810 RepID=A0A4V1IRJ8_9FUNG|nr:hypothetical protein BDK51DRAFT_51763 [Blyttiomyces helicus]|eukprot:RKO90307.1 hypothetical protein BDK51DRAFT_51763 [Blyttiomyces helicus]
MAPSSIDPKKNRRSNAGDSDIAFLRLRNGNLPRRRDGDRYNASLSKSETAARRRSHRVRVGMRGLRHARDPISTRHSRSVADRLRVGERDRLREPRRRLPDGDRDVAGRGCSAILRVGGGIRIRERDRRGAGNGAGGAGGMPRPVHARGASPLPAGPGCFGVMGGGGAGGDGTGAEGPAAERDAVRGGGCGAGDVRAADRGAVAGGGVGLGAVGETWKTMLESAPGVRDERSCERRSARSEATKSLPLRL